ncbi:hypothetical protein SAE01_12720 [Segetibacter aerophilus]|uniref:Uncharacterized protein n=2 Tax=Segetibacter aerophilus TaxID=670293 RepID=A0A512B9Y4_9BACT|nr:hypothetical protein SAE01_12720 [Segetibacter aerophilus]
MGCEDLPEKARIRRGAWIHSSVVDLITADPRNETVWNTHIATGKVVILAELSGTMDGGSPKLGPGFGDTKERYQGSDFKATIKDENYIENWPHYRSLVGKSNWYFCYITGTQGHITGNPVTVAPKNPITENVDDSVIWEAEISWFEFFTPAPFKAPLAVFAAPIAPAEYDALIKFDVSATPTAVSGITGVAEEIDAQQRLEFNATPPVVGGAPQTMDIEVNGEQEASFSYLSGRNGSYFRYTDKAGNTHQDQFINGTKSF